MSDVYLEIGEMKTHEHQGQTIVYSTVNDGYGFKGLIHGIQIPNWETDPNARKVHEPGKVILVRRPTEKEHQQIVAALRNLTENKFIGEWKHTWPREKPGYHIW